MSDQKELKRIAKMRLRTAKILIDGKDWDAAWYMMGYALECALKAVVCKTLHLSKYPKQVDGADKSSFFMTHRFDRLQVVSGLCDLFSFGEVGYRFGLTLRRNMKEGGPINGMRLAKSTGVNVSICTIA
ncbi:HEPN domain-containing protein [Candidatus Uhrbacteria bacterium]|nr:HEPN domain-containing protein [Candidatus Uhrbacteria bacterium]